MAKAKCAVHLLDVGPEQYGDAVLCQFGSVSVLIDGAHPGNHVTKDDHPSIPEQIAGLLGSTGPSTVDVLIVTHAHDDHIGCLPRLVKDGVLKANYALVADPDYGWGRSGSDAGVGDFGTVDTGALDEDLQQVVAALREEIRPSGTPDSELRELFVDAVTLKSRYLEMLETLRKNGTNIIRHGRDSPAALIAFLKGKNVTLEILGPKPAELIASAKRLGQGMDAIVTALQDMPGVDEVFPDTVGIYRRLVSGMDELDAARVGQFVNLQSIVTLFTFRKKKCLFTGDMQLADPQTSDATLIKGNRRLLSEIKARGPYDFVKLAHHGSGNGLSDEVLADMGMPTTIGICAGEGSSHHPAPEVLKLLKDHKGDTHWVRTDRNGASTVDLSGTNPKLIRSYGEFDDATPNSIDEPPESLPAMSVPLTQVPPFSSPIPPAPIEKPQDKETVEVLTRVPHKRTRVTITIDVEPMAAGSVHDAEPVRKEAPSFVVASGRPLPKLLFVTDSRALASRIGAEAVSQMLRALGQTNGIILDQAFSTGTASSAAQVVRTALNGNQVKGVVLVGGFETVPSKRIDCLHKDLREKIGPSPDPDNFVVWSDDIYGDVDQDLMPELPVSRIPDGGSAELLRGALGAGHPGGVGKRCGIRNINRPFADDIHADIPGSGGLLRSATTTATSLGTGGLGEHHVYLMLHGREADGTRFWGEETAGDQEAMNISNLPKTTSGVVFTGCCWGALTVEEKAIRVTGDRMPRERSPDTSLALKFLAAGVRGFVGCTGAHWSPQIPPYKYFGQPLHAAFWKYYGSTGSPAEALLRAKQEYQGGMPHGLTEPIDQAVECKMLRQYTCLGLGW